jgi:hypothetical protein
MKKDMNELTNSFRATRDLLRLAIKNRNKKEYKKECRVCVKEFTRNYRKYKRELLHRIFN